MFSAKIYYQSWLHIQNISNQEALVDPLERSHDQDAWIRGGLFQEHPASSEVGRIDPKTITILEMCLPFGGS